MTKEQALAARELIYHRKEIEETRHANALLELNRELEKIREQCPHGDWQTADWVKTCPWCWYMED